MNNNDTLGLPGRGQDGKTIKVVGGCPCFKVFGEEKLCVNDDNIIEVDPIELDPSIFILHNTKEDIEQERASDDNICYMSIYINYPDNRVYCISQGWKLRIHGKDVPGDDLEDALQFLTTKDTSNLQICSECLYKFILTLADTFSDMLTLKEKTEEVKKYVNKFALMIAIKFSQMDGMEPIGTEEDIKEGMDHFLILKRYLMQLLEQERYWQNVHKELVEENIDERIIDLVAMRERLARLEFQFYSQTLQLRDIYDFNLLIKMMRFILQTSNEILDINAKIHNMIQTKEFKEILKDEPRLRPFEKYGEKSRSIEHNFGNILQILSRI